MKLTQILGRCALAAVLAFGTIVGTAGLAFADAAKDAQAIPSSTSTTTSTYLRGAATRAAMPALEILGINSVEESGQFITLDSNGRPQYDWEQPKYFLAASNYNTELSPLLANLATSTETPTDPAAVVLEERTGGGSGPNASLGEDDDEKLVWALSPKLVIGTGGSNYQSVYSKYGAVGVTYNFSDYAGLISTMYAIAQAADSLAASESLSLRYGSATDIATKYAAYINGTVSYIKSKHTETLPTVALVTNYENGVYTIASSFAQDGTASQNRYLEATVGTELATNLNTNTDDTVINVGKSALQGVDLIMVGGQSSSSNYETIYNALKADGLLDKTYYVVNNGSQGSMYGVVMNSVENAQNIGRILGMLYSDIIDQQSWLAYYYEEFYHIKSSDLAYVMSYALNGVRCAAKNSSNTNNDSDKLTEWDLTTAYSEDWSKAKVAEAIGLVSSSSS